MVVVRRPQAQARTPRQPVRTPRGSTAGGSSSADRPQALRIRYRGQLPALPYPHAQEEQLAAGMGAIVRRAWTEVMPRVIAAYRSAHEKRADARQRVVPPPAPDELERVIEEAGVTLGRYLEVDSQARTAIARTAADVARMGQRANTALFAQVLGMDPLAGNDAWLQPIMDTHGQAMAELIRRVGHSSHERIADAVRDTWHRGRRPTELAATLEAQMGISSRRAELIARDQVGKLNAGLNECRQAAAGIEEYEWRDSNDRRVRALHRERGRDRARFRWAEPPNEEPYDGHPGMPIQCRCRPRPIIPDVETLTPLSADVRAERVETARRRILETAGI